KPVHFRFLDYSSLALRRYFCEEEVRLNRRLAPGVYLGVVPVTWDGVRLHVEQPGSVVEWAVKMRRLPEGATLSAILDRDEPGPGLIEKLAARIAAFHAAAQRSPQIAAECRFDGVARLVRENLGEAAAFVGSIVDAALFRRLQALIEQRLLELRPLFDERALRGVPCDAHGDLRLEHVYLFPEREPPEDILIVDCIEFDNRLRTVDPVSDMAFLAMELFVRGRQDPAGQFCRAYFLASGDAQGAELLPFYVAYRAIVRAKVEVLKATEAGIASSDRDRASASAVSHWMLAVWALEEPDRLLRLIDLPRVVGRCAEAKSAAENDWRQSDPPRRAMDGCVDRGARRADTVHSAATSWWRGSGTAMGTFLIALALAFLSAIGLVAWQWFRACREVLRGLDALTAGKKTRQILIDVWGPMSRLIGGFNAAAQQVQARIDRLEEDRQQLRVVLGAMAEAVIAVDARRRLLFANTSADALFGLDGSSVGRLVPELIRSPQVQSAVEETLRLSHPDAYQGEVSFPLRETALRSPSRILSVRGTPLHGLPPSGAVLVFHDVTDLRRLERMRQDFVANASHELKTPVASIKAYTETLIDWALHDESVNRRFLDRIDEQVERLNQLIRDMLSLARLESSQEFFEHGPLSLVPVLESCLEAHRGRAETKNLSFTFSVDGLDGETLVLADEEAIRQIFDNLVDNAIKYTPEGGKVRVDCSQTPDAVIVEVVDTGIGIPHDELGRIFERFYRVDKARSRELGGTGLGLSIVKHLISSIHGQIEVASRPGSGSRFAVKIPRCATPALQKSRGMPQKGARRALP
ncbi:MAG TPA: ATP-binding protein, partial [Isosphaeraceae bacterium]|nr:ATP-binding protein [Isosphaeraceae bacterium]